MLANTRIFCILALAVILLLPLALPAPTVRLTPVPKMVFLDNSGNPLTSGTVDTFVAGTTTPQASYTDSTGAVLNANPIVLDSAGRADIWLDVALSYKFVVKDSGGSTLYTVDNVTAADVNRLQGTYTAVTFSSTPTFNSALADIFAITLAGNVTSSTVSNATTGDVIAFQICQDATGGRTFTWAATFLRPPTIASGASACTNTTFFYDGTNWRPLAATGDNTQLRVANAIRFADQFTSIQAAIDDLPATGGVVYVPSGTYTSAATVLLDQSDMVLWCEDSPGASGSGGTLIQSSNAAVDVLTITADRVVVKGCKLGYSVAADAGTYAVHARGTNMLRLTDVSTWQSGNTRNGLFLDGNATDGQVINVFITRSHFVNCTDRGIVMTGTSAGNNVQEVNINGSHIAGNGSDGIQINDFVEGIYVGGRTRVTNNALTAASSHSINIAPTTTNRTRNITIREAVLDITTVAGSNNIFGQNTDRVIVTTNWIGSAAAEGIEQAATSTQWEIVGNLFLNNVNAMNILGDNNLIAANILGANPNAGTGTGIVLASGADDNTVEANHIRGNTTAISNSGTNNLIVGNREENSTRFLSNQPMVENGHRVLTREADDFTVGTSHTGSLSETTIRTITTPANHLGTNGGLLLHVVGSIANGGAPAAKTIRVKFGGTTLATVVRTAANAQNWEFNVWVFNRASASSQLVSGHKTSDDSTTIAAAILGTAAIDTTLNADITITGQLVDTGDTITVAQATLTYQLR